MHIVSVGVYGHHGQLRNVDFKPGGLNILTGKSKTGKSALLDIVEFCLGRDTVTIPTGVISDKAAWYTTLLQFADKRVLILRPNPESATTNRAVVVLGDRTLVAPATSEGLEVNADTEVVKDVLTEHLGIDRFTVEPEQGSLRNPFEVSSKQAIFFSFQNQNEIANRAVLFHRQNEPDIRPTIRGVLPYFLGASTPEQSAIQRQLLQARRSLQRIQLELRTTEADLGQQGDRTFQILRSAVSLGVLDSQDETITDPSQARLLLERIRAYRVTQDSDTTSEAGARQAELLDEGTVLRRRLQELDDQIGLMRRLEAEHSDATSELAIQRDRLSAINVLLPRRVSEDGPASSCPLCEQELPHPDESVQSLQQLLVDLDGRLVASRGSQARRESLIESLGESRDRLRESLRENAADLNAAAVQNQELANGRAQREQIAFLQGRVSQELERGVQVEGGLEELRSAERRVRGQLARLEELFEADDPTENMKRTMDGVGELITLYARALQLEGSEFPARLDPAELTVSYVRPGGRVPLARMGSAENWVGYHLATHLALHHWLVTHDRPTPRFLMLDQPTQAFFPEEVVDAAEDEDADWAAVRRQFELLRDVVETLSGELQVIVCDHANLADDWFQDAVVDNWRNGVALIPSDWPTRDEYQRKA
ncbi:DUF3732 domain-containing protein [Aeromicrobium wangtongii]|uniref:DUF3732 domain-containing protein n=1 Tax=Aeromicrobium wangtongii TaxID=2969247 RepID=A0ABY5MD44_9ACTN|nr:DUF3732 domain-containing protein [Aeromicrobium wangtongii]MCD9197427.1 DUF3732 domain-containing protein [Aeromicrobium wangtongii]UUP14920.1 DUF3732 domain-containing protein [Aeromicrobium wangtongii]